MTIKKKSKNQYLRTDLEMHEFYEDKLILFIGFMIACTFVCGTIFMLTGCQNIPEIAKTIDDIATDDAISVYVDKDAFQKETDVHVIVDIINKEPLPPAK